MIAPFIITWVEMIPELFNKITDLDKNYKLSNKNIATIVYHEDDFDDALRFDFGMDSDYYEFEIVNDDSDYIIYTTNTVRIKSARLYVFVMSQLQTESNNIILPLLKELK